MIPTTLLAAAALVAIPGPDESVPVTEAGSGLELSSDGGAAWFRLVEDDYTVLRISSDRPALLRAYDGEGGILARAEPGEDLMVSAFSLYWFYISVEPVDGGEVSVTVREVPARELAAGRRSSGRIPGSVMADAYTFVPSEDRRWAVSLEGRDGTDLDLEVYGDGMSLLSGSYSAEGTEALSVNGIAGDTLTVLVSRYNKTGSGEYVLEVDGKGGFPVLEEHRSGNLGENLYQERLAVEPAGTPRMLTLTGTPADADADLYLFGRGREPFYASASYSLEEALLVPEFEERLFCAVVGYDMPSGIRYQLDLTDVPEALTMPARREVSCGTDGVVAVRAEEPGLYLVSVDFNKGRDGDVRIFGDPGEARIVSETVKGSERVLRWMDAGETLCVQPYIPSGEGGMCTLTAAPADPGELAGTASGTVEGEGWDYLSFALDSGAVCAVELDCLQPEADLDLRVTAPGFDRTAEGYLSPADEAGDEAIAVSAERYMEVGVTVYSYDPGVVADYNITADTIRRAPLADGGPEEETWVLAAGISGYPTLADVLNRASMDALDVYRILLDNTGADPSHSVLLADEMATVEAFTSSLRRLARRAGPEDRLLVFFSGHGVQGHPGAGGDEEEDAADESLSLHDGDLLDDSLAALLDRTPATKLLMIDACHSGGFSNDFHRGDDILVITAAREDRSVSERILTPFLLEGISGGADGDGDGTVTARELVGYVDARLARVCPECDALLPEGAVVCSECGTKLVGDNAVPRPEQGRYLDDDFELCSVGGKAGRSSSRAP